MTIFYRSLPSQQHTHTLVVVIKHILVKNRELVAQARHTTKDPRTGLQFTYKDTHGGLRLQKQRVGRQSALKGVDMFGGKVGNFYLLQWINLLGRGEVVELLVAPL